MKKEEYIRRYGIKAYAKMQQQKREWEKKHPEKGREKSRLWKQKNPEKVIATSQDRGRKGGKYYEHTMKYMMSGLPHERNLVRMHHRYLYRPYKQVIAPDSQIHHQWVPGTANYTGVALVEKDQHMHGFIDVIQILEGEITLLSEEDIRKGGK